MVQSVIFIDQPFHKRTRSTAFLEEILSRRFSVSRFFLPSLREEDVGKLRSLVADLFVVFQYDFLVPLLLSVNRRVVVVPMYDGTGEIFDAHWQLQKEALFINFSNRLHKRLLTLGLKTHFFQAFPEPPRLDEIRGRFTGPRYFLWERRPQDGISAVWLAGQIATHSVKPEFVRLHLAPDPGQTPSTSPLGAHSLFGKVPVRVSTWFSSRSEYQSALDSCSIFVAPRNSEGLGWSFLEAMARGMLVFAKNRPTHNEYISNFETGIFFDTYLPCVDSSLIRRIGQNSAEFMQQGWKNWVRRQNDLLDVICDYLRTPAPDPGYTFDEVLHLPALFFLAARDYQVDVGRLLHSRDGAAKPDTSFSYLARLERVLFRRPQLYAYVRALYMRWQERKSR